MVFNTMNAVIVMTASACNYKQTTLNGLLQGVRISRS